MRSMQMRFPISLILQVWHLHKANLPYLCVRVCVSVPVCVCVCVP